MAKVRGKILIVDDEESMRELLAHLIEVEGLTPLVAPEGETALKMMRREAPDVLLVDHKMPGLTGLEVLRRAREIDEKLPAILLTGYAAVRSAVEAMQAGAYHYLAKPFSHDEVIGLVFRALTERKRPRPLNLPAEANGHGSLRELMGTSKVINREARDGTLFLDEISNLSLGAQAKLLRALQEKVLYRVGGSRPVAVDVRVLAASNHDLQALAASGSFRQDLFFRLNEFAITIPPLRERSEDILYLAHRFLALTNAELNKSVGGFTSAATDALLAYGWPGNVRQLRSTIRRAALLADETIAEEHLNLGQIPAQAGHAALPAQPWRQLPLKEIVRRSTIAVEREILTRRCHSRAGIKRRLRVCFKSTIRRFSRRSRNMALPSTRSMEKPNMGRESRGYAEKGGKKFCKAVLPPERFTKEKMMVSGNNGILEIKCVK